MSVAKHAFTGEKFGRWTLIQDSYIKNKRVHALCKCECGTIKEKRLSEFKKSQSCGCFTKEINTKHGKSKTKIYRIYKSMKNRCYNKTFIQFDNYGGRDISICQEWLDNFLIFEEWALANGYQEGLQIDRINNDLGYSPENCRWVTHAQNQYNKKSYKKDKYKGVFKFENKYVASIVKDRKKHHIGLFKTEEEAAIAYNEKAIELFGEFAYLNEIK